MTSIDRLNLLISSVLSTQLIIRSDIQIFRYVLCLYQYLLVRSKSARLGSLAVTIPAKQLERVVDIHDTSRSLILFLKLG